MHFVIGKRRYIRVIIAAFALIFVLFLFIKSLEPAFWSRVEAYAVSCATVTVNSAAEELLSDIKYSDLVHIRTDNNGDITAIESDSMKMNVLKSKLAVKIDESMAERENGTVYVNLGSISRTPILAGLGPKIGIKIYSANQTIINFRDSMTESGINQVKHKIYLEVLVSLNLTTATARKTSQLKTTVPVADTVIVGTVPRYYGGAGVNILGDENGTDKE